MLIGNINFSRYTFQERLKLQKTVYLLKIFGFDLGYKFNFYIYGPYSVALAQTGSEIRTHPNEQVKPMEFIDPDLSKNFDLFLKFLGEKKTDPRWLELIASIHYLKTSGVAEDRLKSIILSKNTKFTVEEYETAYTYLRNSNL